MVDTLHKITCKKVFISEIGYCNGRYFAYLWCDEPKKFNTRKELFQYIRNNIKEIEYSSNKCKG